MPSLLWFTLYKQTFRDSNNHSLNTMSVHMYNIYFLPQSRRANNNNCGPLPILLNLKTSLSHPSFLASTFFSVSEAHSSLYAWVAYVEKFFDKILTFMKSLTLFDIGGNNSVILIYLLS